MEGMIEKEMTCNICSEEYLDGTKDPLVIPECGHTFCKPCLLNIEESADGECISCPYCRAHSDCMVNSMPINYIAKSILSVWKKPKPSTAYSNCPNHQECQKLWCLECEGPLCFLCYFDGSAHKEHEVITFIEHVRRDIDDLKLNIRTSTYILNQSFACLKLALAPYKEERSRADSLVEQILKDKDLHNVDTACNARSQLAGVVKMMSQNPLKGDQRTLVCVAVTDDRRCGKVSLESGELYLHAVDDTSENDAHITIKLSLLGLLRAPKQARVFMELSVDGETLGRLTICVWSHLRRAQRFMELCLGLSGSSYKRSEFSEVVNSGIAGESFLAGKDLDSSSETETDDLEWGDEYAGPGHPGVVAGWNDNTENSNDLFCVVLSELPAIKFECPFGVVESGLALLKKAASYDPPKVVSITDVGTVLSEARY